MRQNVSILIVLLLFLLVPGVSAITVVSTTSVLWDPVQYIGGEKVQAIYIADPTICPHMQADIIPNRIQMQKDFIKNADMFVAINGSVDKSYVMPFVTDYMAANEYGNITWVTLKDPSMIWNTPDGARNLSREVAGWLITADPTNKTYYEAQLVKYLAEIDAADVTPGERSAISGQDAVVMLWQREAARDWLGLHEVTVFAPDFYERGQFTPRAVVNDIYNNPEKFQKVKYVIENMQSGEMAKGVEEALHDKGIPAKRVIFTNFPKSLPGVNSLPDVIKYNKNLVNPLIGGNATTQGTAGTSSAAAPGPTRASMEIYLLPLSVLAGAIILTSRARIR
jgi:zinc/manganese transport system substrate-binding protein